MSAFTPHDGVDFIFDRYAFLNKLLMEYIKTKVELRSAFELVRVGISVEKPLEKIFYAFANAAQGEPCPPIPEIDIKLLQFDSPDADIKAALKIARVMYHSDRQLNQPQSLQDKAKAMRHIIDKAADILDNPDLRPSYTERLKRFYLDDTRLISFDGTPPQYAFLKEMFSLDSLLVDEAPDTSALEKEIAMMTQFDEKQFQTAKQVYDVAPDNPTFRSMYRDALTKKFTYLELLETTAWQKIGYLNKGSVVNKRTALHADDYAHVVENEIEAVKANIIPQAIEIRMDAMRIGTASAPLLLTDQSAAASAKEQTDRSVPTLLTAEQIEKIKDKAREQVGIRADYVRQLAQQKQEILQELCTFSIVETPDPINDADPVHHIVAILPRGEAHYVLDIIRCDVSTGQNQALENDTLKSLKPYDERALEELRTFSNLHIVRINEELSEHYIHTEALMLTQRLHDAWQERQKNMPKTPAPAPV